MSSRWATGSGCRRRSRRSGTADRPRGTARADRAGPAPRCCARAGRARGRTGVGSATFSSTSTCTPCSRNLPASIMPLGPPPTTITSIMKSPGFGRSGRQPGKCAERPGPCRKPRQPLYVEVGRGTLALPGARLELGGHLPPGDGLGAVARRSSRGCGRVSAARGGSAAPAATSFLYVSPHAHQRHEDGVEVRALAGEAVLVARRAVLVAGRAPGRPRP